MSRDATTGSGTEAEKAGIVVLSGLVRDGNGVILGYCLRELLPDLVARSLDAAGHEIASANAVPRAEVLKGCPPDSVPFIIRVPLRETGRPVSEVSVNLKQSNVLPTLGPDFQLRGLYYPDRASFDLANVGRKRNLRPPDKETSMFMSAQMATMFPVGVDEKSDEARVLMVCSYAYRATEVASRDDAARVIDLIDQFDAQPHCLPFTEMVERYNGSLQIAQWHAATAADDREVFERALNRSLSEAPQVAAGRHAFVFSFNPIRSLCVLAGYSILRGDIDNAVKALDMVAVLLLSAGRVMQTRPSHLKEFARSCVLAANIDYFKPVLKKHAKAPRDALLSAPMPATNGSISDAAVNNLILPSIRSSNAPDVLAAIRRFAART